MCACMYSCTRTHTPFFTGILITSSLSVQFCLERLEVSHPSQTLRSHSFGNSFSFPLRHFSNEGSETRVVLQKASNQAFHLSIVGFLDWHRRRTVDSLYTCLICICSPWPCQPSRNRKRLFVILTQDNRCPHEKTLFLILSDWWWIDEMTVLLFGSCHFLTEWSHFCARHSPGRRRGEWRDPYRWRGVRSSRWERPRRSKVWLDKRRPGELRWVTAGSLPFMDTVSLHLTSLKGHWKDASPLRPLKKSFEKVFAGKQPNKEMEKGLLGAKSFFAHMNSPSWHHAASCF